MGLQCHAKTLVGRKASYQGFFVMDIKFGAPKRLLTHRLADGQGSAFHSEAIKASNVNRSTQ